MMETRQDNDMTHIGAVYTKKKKTELSWSIGPGTVRDEN